MHGAGPHGHEQRPVAGPELPAGALLERRQAGLVAEAAAQLRLKDDDVVVNVQGDEPLIAPVLIAQVAAALEDGTEMSTACHTIHDEAAAANPNVVKAVGSPIGERRLRALYFTRATAPWGDGPRYHHIGLYAYRRAALERFVKLPPSPLEQQEKLEQLRALEAGMRIDIIIVDIVPRGVDTPPDLETARRILAPRSD